jgi:hypothetical protein
MSRVRNLTSLTTAPLAAFVIVGEEKHTGTQDPTRGTSRARLAAGVRDWLHDWGCKCGQFWSACKELKTQLGRPLE